MRTLKKIVVVLCVLVLILIQSCTKESSIKGLKQFIELPVSKLPIYAVAISNSHKLIAVMERHTLQVYQNRNGQYAILLSKELPGIYCPSSLFLDESKERVILIDNQLPIYKHNRWIKGDNSFLFGEEYINAYIAYNISFNGEMEIINLNDPYISHFNKNYESDKFQLRDSLLYYQYSPVINMKEFPRQESVTNLSPPDKKIFYSENIIEHDLQSNSKKVIYNHLSDLQTNYIQSFDIDQNHIVLLKTEGKVFMYDLPMNQPIQEWSVTPDVTDLIILDQNTLLLKDQKYYYLFKEGQKLEKIVPVSWRLIKTNSAVFFIKPISIEDDKIQIFKMNWQEQ